MLFMLTGIMVDEDIVEEDILTILLQLWSFPVRIKAIAVESIIGLSRL